MGATDGLKTEVMEHHLRSNKYYNERNLWLCFFGLTTWAVAWRLKRLSDCKQFVPPTRASKKQGRYSRALWALGALGALVIADIPLCRVNYNMQISYTVTPKKEELLVQAGRCEGAMLSNAKGECATFCQDVRKLSEERSACVKFVRDWHVLGRVAAEIFDDARGVEQGKSRMDAIFTRKSCTEVNRSVDKSNKLVNGFCFAVAFISITVFVMALTNVFDGSAGEAIDSYKVSTD